ncbi:MAG: protease complex subunit PrcB family protein [Acidobacteriota bacterium]
MNKFLRFFPVVLVGLSLTLGGSQYDSFAQDEPAIKQKSIEFKSLVKNSISAQHQANNFVIKSREELKSLWNVFFKNIPDKPELPDVDFEKKMVIAIFGGEKPSPGHEITASETLQLNKKTLRVSYVISQPGNNCLHPMMLAQPFHIIEVDKYKRVIFNAIEQTRDCPND